MASEAVEGADASVVVGADAGLAGADAAHPAMRALGRIDAVIAAKPEKDDAELAAAVENICAWRRGMIARRDAKRWDDAAERDLGTLNGVLSLVLAIQFPLGEVRWNELDKARAVLAELAGRG
ncbi:MAG: hypothetical protein INR65_12345 [Gluconacetobacter diazotrophicus]|nr:hypothetical protein [Gluconacetobacter diazotrophicus]